MMNEFAGSATPQSSWLNTTEMYCLTILGARSLKGKCQQGYTPPEGSGEEAFRALLMPGFL